MQYCAFANAFLGDIIKKTFRSRKVFFIVSEATGA